MSLVEPTTWIVEGPPNGAPILFLHGGGLGVDATTNWRPVLDELARSHRCIAPDLLGFGAAAAPRPLPAGRDAWLRLWVQQCVELLARLEVDRVDVIGNSAVGGALALRLLVDCPDRVVHAAIMGGAGVPSGPDDRSTQPGRTFDAGSLPDHVTLRATLERFSAAPDVLGPRLDEIVRARLENIARPEIREAFAAMWTAGDAASPATSEELAAISRPVLLLHGARDRLADPARSWGLFGRLANAGLVMVPEAGHWVHLDQPETFVSLVSGFFADRLLPATPAVATAPPHG